MADREPRLIKPTELGLKSPIPIPRDKKGRIKWSLLKDEPEVLEGLIEERAREILAQTGAVTSKTIRSVRDHRFYQAIFEFYPGKLYGLQEKLNQPTSQLPKNFWTTPEALDYVREQAAAIVTEKGRLSTGLLVELGKGRLLHGIRVYYPGKFPGLYRDMGLDANHKPDGYWTPEVIIDEAVKFIQEHGSINQKMLLQNGRSDLANAISKQYPGKWQGFRKDTLLKEEKKPSGYWTIENMEHEAIEFFKTHGTLTHESLNANGLSGLAVTVNRTYPGGMKALKEKIGITLQKATISPEEANKELNALFEEVQ